jgi:hypothetical protein
MPNAEPGPVLPLDVELGDIEILRPALANASE